jgi:uncharacterized protein with HEPN domain
MKETHILLCDMVDAINKIKSYQLSSFEEFECDGKTQDAIMFKLIILGEAANCIAPEFTEDHPEIPWSSIIGTRNVIVHGYDQVRLSIVWDIIQKDLSLLEKQLKLLIE